MNFNSEKLKNAIYRGGYTVKEFSKVAGLNPSYIPQACFRGHMTAYYFYQIAKALNIEPEAFAELIGVEDTANIV